MTALRKVALFGGLAVAFLATASFMHFKSGPAAAIKSISGPDKGFAVVELFTSEGCSSCPSADQLVARIQQEDKDRPVYILAFHVDYWNSLGWKDEFSDARYSQRQNQYASWLNLQSVYTPQVVVNGRKEFVGSQESTLRQAIDNGLQTASAAQIMLNAIRQDQGRIEWHYQVQNGGSNLSLLVAVVQRSATTKVRAGENSGRTLSHVQIVRNFTTSAVGAGTAGTGSLALPQGVTGKEEELIAFLQNNNNGQIVAAANYPLQ